MPTFPVTQDQLKKLSIKNCDKNNHKENNKVNGSTAQKENRQNGNGNCVPADLILAVEKGVKGSLGGKKSVEVGGEADKQADSIKRMSELVARNPLYTSLHR